jgi:hypothetical protein
MIIHFQGRTYDFDDDRITVDEFREMKRKYKLTARAFDKGVTEGDPDALTCLYWVMQRQAGNHDLVLSDEINFPVGPLYTAISDAQAAEEEANKAELEAQAEQAAAAVPTQPAGPTSSAPPSPPATTPASPGPSPADPGSSSGSGPETSSSSAASTSTSSPVTAGSEPSRSGG